MVNIEHTNNTYALAYVGSGTLNNEWHHLVWGISTFGIWTIYIDGVLQTGLTIDNYPRSLVNTTENNNSYIFDSVQTSQAKESIVDFGIFSRVFTATEVSVIFTKQHTITPETIDADYE